MAAMQAIPSEIYEAARIDGASTWRQFYHITLPNLRYIILVMVVLHVTFTFNNFDFVYLSTGGGPVNSTEVLPTFIYEQAWNGYELGLRQRRRRGHADRPRRVGVRLPKIYRRIFGGMKKSKKKAGHRLQLGYSSSTRFSSCRSSGSFFPASEIRIRSNLAGSFRIHQN